MSGNIFSRRVRPTQNVKIKRGFRLKSQLYQFDGFSFIKLPIRTHIFPRSLFLFLFLRKLTVRDLKFLFPEEINCIVSSSNMVYVAGVYLEDFLTALDRYNMWILRDYVIKRFWLTALLCFRYVFVYHMPRGVKPTPHFRRFLRPIRIKN